MWQVCCFQASCSPLIIILVLLLHLQATATGWYHAICAADASRIQFTHILLFGIIGHGLLPVCQLAQGTGCIQIQLNERAHNVSTTVPQ